MAYYFKHDDNARRDPKILRLCRVKGMKGYGIYWALIEILHEQGGKLNEDEIKDIAFELREDEANILSVLKEFDLFVLQQQCYSNARVLESLEDRLKTTSDASAKARKRWELERIKNQQVNATALPQQSVSNAIIQEKIIEDNINIPFSAFWDLYNKKVGAKEKCESKWRKLTETEREKIMSTLPVFLSKIKDKQFQPHAETYLNQKRWNDDLSIIQTIKPRVYN